MQSHWMIDLIHSVLRISFKFKAPINEDWGLFYPNGKTRNVLGERTLARNAP